MRITAAVALALVTVVALAGAVSGCVQQPTPVIPTSPPSVAPVFKSDADALAAARKTFENYLKTSDEITSDGGEDSARLKKWETASQFTRDRKVFVALASKGERIKGSSAYSDLRFQALDQDANGVVNLRTYVCLDISRTELVDSRGHTIPNAGPTVAPLVVTFVNSSPGNSALLVDRSASWDGSDFCPES